jgi:AcrR family transcriptional regulator
MAKRAMTADVPLAREDWLRAARLALLTGGAAAVRVETLARELGVTKGSFYWHIRDRADLLDALLVDWEEEEVLLSAALLAGDRDDAIRSLFEEVGRRTAVSGRGEAPSDTAIFAWAATDPAVANRVRKAEKKRMQLLRELVGDDDLADFLYYAYQGFLMRRRRAPEAAADFPKLERTALSLLQRREAAVDRASGRKKDRR